MRKIFVFCIYLCNLINKFFLGGIGMVKIVFALFVSVLGTAILLDNIGDEE